MRLKRRRPYLVTVRVGAGLMLTPYGDYLLDGPYRRRRDRGRVAVIWAVSIMAVILLAFLLRWLRGL